MPKIKFGMHKGKDFSDIPHDYLLWMLKNCQNGVTIKIKKEIAKILGDKTPIKTLEEIKMFNTPIEERAAEHKRRYPTFNLERFLEYLYEKPGRKQWAKNKTIAELNKRRKSIDSILRMCENDDD
jgi:uncharacterized protein (DUF3820 family)